jgi:phosphotriesterase-related protein
MAGLVNGMVITARGLVAPERLGCVMMHEHLHADLYDWRKDQLITEEKPTKPHRRRYLLKNAVPLLKRCRKSFGMRAFLDTTMPPWRAWPTLYAEVSAAADMHIVLCTGFYREIETGTYFVKTPDQAIWPLVRQASVEELVELCGREILDGIHGTQVHAGAIKLGSSQAPMTETEIKAFRAGARVQKQTGVHITTHCTRLGAETSQLTILDQAGVDLTRVVIGHTAAHLLDRSYRRTVLEWMKRGANFMPTNLGIRQGEQERWRPLVEAIGEVFAAGHGDKLVLGLDSGYCSESGPFAPMKFLPPPPFVHMFTHTLPAFREMGLTAEQEEAIMRRNPQRLLPIRM